MGERLNRKSEKNIAVSTAAGAGSVIAGGTIGLTVSPEVGVAFVALGFTSPFIGLGTELVRLRRSRRSQNPTNHTQESSRQGS